MSSNHGAYGGGGIGPRMALSGTCGCVNALMEGGITLGADLWGETIIDGTLLSGGPTGPALLK